MSGRQASERGSATPFAVAVMGLLVLVGAALGVAGAMVHAHRVAQSAADLAALAGAHSLAEGGDGCAAATTIAEANGARVDSCEVAGFDLRVQVTVTGPRWLGQRHDLSAEARAGPGGPSDGLTPSAGGLRAEGARSEPVHLHGAGVGESPGVAPR
jgi:secretion/DNA translocation related TadE-like protein